MWDYKLTGAMCKEVILTLLQFAAKLCQNTVYTTLAIELIESKQTREILSLGVRKAFDHDFLQQRSPELSNPDNLADDGESYLQQLEFSSTSKRAEAHQLDCQATILEHVTSLCRSYGAALQTTLESPTMDGYLILHSFITVSYAFNLDEKQWLLTTLPEILHSSRNLLLFGTTALPGLRCGDQTTPAVTLTLSTSDLALERKKSFGKYRPKFKDHSDCKRRPEEENRLPTIFEE